MILSLVVAMDELNGIGVDNHLPWHVSADLKLFKQNTMGHYLIMGRKTYDSIGRALPGRTTIVLTRSADFQAPDVIIAHSLEVAISIARRAGETEACVIGGGQVFAQALPLADRIYLTRVHARLTCDTFFPSFDPTGWAISESVEHPADERNEYAFTYQVLERAAKP